MNGHGTEGRRRLRATALFYLFLLVRASAAETGPTLHFDYGSGRAPANPLISFMYFVPLISPQPVSVFTNAGNTQMARVVSLNCHTNGLNFHATCDFELAGTGVERNVIDRTAIIRGHEQSLQAGKVLAHQLASIDVTGPGLGCVEVDGVVTNGQATVTEVRLRFNRQGHLSPVTIGLEDLACRDGVVQQQNEMVARVNQLYFRQQAGRTEMEVILDSVKAKAAADGFWQNFMGGLKGMAANAFLPPLRVASDGYEAMMNFGLALALAQPGFTFPLATRLVGDPAGIP